jgi:carbamoyltransferase
MEFGPRALGARSILASPLHASMQAKLNEIKDREDFRPVAPVVLEEEAANWFAGARQSPFMLFVYDVPADKADRIPAVRHVDGTARIQTINREQHALYYDLLKAFQKRTGVPVLVNTSFNTRGEPIVCTPRDAVESFWTSPLDALVIGPFLLEKTGGPE